uniref:NR LBD domain-containing protein n=1 Tax=Acrobeloides nanus TaxID=290746 RepID=A0A914C783_9BILA
MGMTKDVLHPKRDTIGARYAKQHNSPLHDHVPDQEAEASTSNLHFPIISNQEQDLLNAIAKFVNDDCRIRDRKYDTFNSHTEAVKLAQTVLSEDSTINGQGLKIYYLKDLRLVQKYDMSMVTSRELYSMIEWAQGLDDFKQLPLNVRMILLKRFAIYHIVLETGYYTAKNSELNDIWMITNGACMPRFVEMLPVESQKIISPDRKWRQEKLWNQMTNRQIDEVALPMRRLKLRPEELVTLKLIMFFQFNSEHDSISLSDGTELLSKILSQEASNIIANSRNKAIQALIAFYKSINLENYAERFGNVILSISGIVSAASALLEAYQVMRLFVCKFDSLTEQLLFDGDGVL